MPRRKQTRFEKNNGNNSGQKLRDIIKLEAASRVRMDSLDEPADPPPSELFRAQCHVGPKGMGCHVDHRNEGETRTYIFRRMMADHVPTDQVPKGPPTSMSEGKCLRAVSRLALTANAKAYAAIWTGLVGYSDAITLANAQLAAACPEGNEPSSSYERVP